MSHHVSVTVTPTAATDTPTGRLGGTGRDIPIVTFSDNGHTGMEVSLQLGNHPDPVAYLSALATAAWRLADEYEAARAEVTA